MSSRVHERPLLTVRQVADQPSVSERTIRRLAERGEIPALKVGHSALGRAFWWYMPGRFHKPVAPEEKARLYAGGKSFREE